MSAKKSKRIQEDIFPEDVENVETNENVETSENVEMSAEPTSLDELKKRQDELKAELTKKQEEFKAEMDEKRVSLKKELAEKRATLKTEQIEKREALKEERAKERAKKAEIRTRESIEAKIAKMEVRHKIAMAKLENLGDTVNEDVAASGLAKDDTVEFKQVKTGESLTGVIKGFFPYGRSYTTAAKIAYTNADGEAKICYRSITKLTKVE